MIWIENQISYNTKVRESLYLLKSREVEYGEEGKEGVFETNGH